MSRIKKGEQWYLRLPGASAIATRWILEVTDKTVLLHECCMEHRKGIRHLISGLEFVEKV